MLQSQVHLSLHNNGVNSKCNITPFTNWYTYLKYLDLGIEIYCQIFQRCWRIEHINGNQSTDPTYIHLTNDYHALNSDFNNLSTNTIKYIEKNLIIFVVTNKIYIICSSSMITNDLFANNLCIILVVLFFNF